MGEGYLKTKQKSDCFGCEACVQVCPKNALKMQMDKEGFSYPVLDKDLCIDCGLCHKSCPAENMPKRYDDNKYVFGGYIKDKKIRHESTSGGAFTAIADKWCDENYVIFGAQVKGLKVFHGYTEDKAELYKFRKSKYSQSEMGDSFKRAAQFLKQGKKVLFSGTPCQIAGLKSYLGGAANDEKLLTVEVICEGIPSAFYMKSYEKYINKRYGSGIESLDYRYTDNCLIKGIQSGRWDFQVMNIVLKNGKTIKQDRWFNPFWSIWLQHLMSRPSCYECRFTNTERVADITLGDLWGVHIYCSELYGRNGGASLVICNTEKGKKAFIKARELMYGHELDFEAALRYQGPMRKSIAENPMREQFLADLLSLDHKQLCKKWSKKPDVKLLYSKYIWGNRQKVAVKNLKSLINKTFQGERK